eukprot:TRINITY_DN2869_c0_g1_i1.p1 TRINITY_DN2869_c0_g1~~TRINITY_DN2869_c0_g1_i1.p1  ORF type:complete len:156 (-),score=40.05 TRINITY_DN2869_c0_g1_i1:599-1066(-)
MSAYTAHALKYYYNVDGTPPSEHFITSCRIIIAVAAADGDFSQQERQAFFAILKTAGASDEILDQVAKINAKDVNIDAELPKLKGDHEASRRHLVFAAAAVAVSDGFQGKERETLYKVGEQLGVAKDVVDGIVNGAVKENEGRLERLKYMGNQKF